MSRAADITVPMAAPLDLDSIRQAVHRRRYRFTNHARKQQRLGLAVVNSEDQSLLWKQGFIAEVNDAAKAVPEREACNL